LLQPFCCSWCGGYGYLVAMTMTRRLVPVAGGRNLDVFVVGAEGAPLVVNLPGTPEGHVLFPSVEQASALAGSGSCRSRAPATAVLPACVADVVPDVLAVVDALGVQRFAVVGSSGGGPHALARGALAGDRCVAVAVVSGVGPGPRRAWTSSPEWAKATRSSSGPPCEERRRCGTYSCPGARRWSRPCPTLRAGPATEGRSGSSSKPATVSPRLSPSSSEPAMSASRSTSRTSPPLPSSGASLLSQPEVLWARPPPPGASWNASLVGTVFIAALGHPPRRRRLLPGYLPPSGGRRCPLFNDGRDVRAPV